MRASAASCGPPAHAGCGAAASAVQAEAARTSRGAGRIQPRRSPCIQAVRAGRSLDQLDAIEAGGGNGVARAARRRAARGHQPRQDLLAAQLKLTKGDLFRHYVRVAPCILPVLADRPLVMKRYPNGVDGKPFYQHRAPDKLPPGVRVEHGRRPATRPRPHLIGGVAASTLLYTAQLAAISQDPWFSRVGSRRRRRPRRDRSRSA